jgi:hypothetical protein
MITKVVPIGSIKPWGKNPRKNDEAARKLAELIKIYGVRSPLVVWQKNMTVYKGNTTLKACKLLGMKEVPVTFATFKSEQEATAYALSDNKASEWAEWDDGILEEIFSSGEWPDGMTGFTEKEIQGISFGFDEKEVDRIKADANAKLRARIIIVACNESDAEEIRTSLKEWTKDCGFEKVEVK